MKIQYQKKKTTTAKFNHIKYRCFLPWALKNMSVMTQFSTATEALTAISTRPGRHFRNVYIHNFHNENDNLNIEEKIEYHIKFCNQFIQHEQFKRRLDASPTSEFNNFMCDLLSNVTDKDGSK
ncbi:hypothetical protein DPMN_048130 [Dreissena polymorpha]|uniref:Uncharacterized protein n=1 Tax=Dreissena polymorpha TaxID=45954 RepID=A0A9D4DA66_DREPO|nr:hypothetical protein DPMN_048130 [Dreissena polymorpha]